MVGWEGKGRKVIQRCKERAEEPRKGGGYGIPAGYYPINFMHKKPLNRKKVKTDVLLVGDKGRRSESQGTDSPLTLKYGLSFGRAGLHKPDAAGYLRHEGSRPPFTNVLQNPGQTVAAAELEEAAMAGEDEESHLEVTEDGEIMISNERWQRRTTEEIQERGECS
ncbi:hypothetical protein SAY86_021081 [Trapa natans]|uniref:Uncharacterized protein n=1 Tax=Trapa natans TaxID=22666 RepID=A0AAN7M952_TRANT|nr:hypothetical protein SAY86_021081 [Trapa natans]